MRASPPANVQAHACRDFISPPSVAFRPGQSDPGHSSVLRIVTCGATRGLTKINPRDVRKRNLRVMDPSAIWLSWPKFDASTLVLALQVFLLLAIVNLFGRAVFPGFTPPFLQGGRGRSPRMRPAIRWGHLAALPLASALAAFALGFPAVSGVGAAALALAGEGAATLFFARAPSMAAPWRGRAARTAGAFLSLLALHVLLDLPNTVSIVILVSWLAADRLLAAEV